MRTEPVEILLVDDNEDDIIIVNEALSEAKMLNIIASLKNGEEAVAYLKKEGEYSNAKRPGIVLLDINMPKKNGFEVLEEVKADPKLKDIPIIMLTVSTYDEDIIKSYEYGACSYISKPVNFDKLKEVIKNFELYWTLVSKIPDNSPD